MYSAECILTSASDFRLTVNEWFAGMDAEEIQLVNSCSNSIVIAAYQANTTETLSNISAPALLPPLVLDDYSFSSY